MNHKSEMIARKRKMGIKTILWLIQVISYLSTKFRLNVFSGICVTRFYNINWIAN